MSKFRRKEIEILVATDVAARGIDVEILRQYLTMIFLLMMKIMSTGSEEQQEQVELGVQLTLLQAGKFTG